MSESRTAPKTYHMLTMCRDQDSLHVQQADEAICIGPADSQPYQNIEALVKVAREAKADAIHPGLSVLNRWQIFIC